MDNLNQHSNPIHDAFGKFNRKAPDGIWEKLNHDLSADATEQAVNHAFSRYSKTAPESAWVGIKKNLLIDDVWNKISADLDKRKRRKVFYYFSGVATLGFIMLMIYFMTDRPPHATGNERAYFSKHEVRTPAGNYDNSVIMDGSRIEESDVIISNSTTGENQTSDKIVNPGVNAIEFTTTNEPTSSFLPEVRLEFSSDQQIKMNPVSLTDEDGFSKLPSTRICSIRPDLHFPPVEINPTNEEGLGSSFEIGSVASINNTWIFSEDVKQGFKRYSLVSNEFTLGYDAGLFINYYLNESSAVGFQADILSQHNQRYSSYSEGSVCYHKISFSQLKTSLYYKYQRKSTWMQNHALTFRGGVYSAYNAKSTFYENGLQSTEKLYEKFDFGLLVAAGSKHSFGNFALEYGINSNAGVLNLTKNSTTELKKFSYTTSYFTGIYLALSYRLK